MSNEDRAIGAQGVREPTGNIDDVEIFEPTDVVVVASLIIATCSATPSRCRGVDSAALFLSSQLDITFRIPGIGNWSTVLEGHYGFARDRSHLDRPLLSPISGPEEA
jgi:hypothetical protein